MRGTTRAEGPRRGPLLVTFRNLPGLSTTGMLHVCCDLRLEPTADTSTRGWCLGENVFVGADGQDLKHFAGAVDYWETTGKLVYVLYQVLQRFL